MNNGVLPFIDPLPATYEPTNTPLLIYGVDRDAAFVQFDDGRLDWVSLGSLNADFRLDYRTGEWVSTGLFSGDESDNDSEDDGRAGVPGGIPEPDGTGDGDQGDEAGDDPWDLDAAEETR